MHHFIQGINCIRLGARDCLDKDLRRYVTIPLLVNILIFGMLFFWGMHYSIEKLSFLTSTSFSLPNWLAWLHYIIEFVQYIFIIILFVLFFSIFAILSTIGANLLGCPFNSFLSESGSKKLGYSPSSKAPIQSIKDSIVRESRKLIYTLPRLILLAIVCLILNFIPPLNLLIPILFYWFNAYFMAIQYIDYPAENFDLSFDELLLLLKKNRSLCMGYGLIVVLLSSIPLINFIVMPIAVLGATRLWHLIHLEKHAK